jgi:hypothetical protein
MRALLAVLISTGWSAGHPVHQPAHYHYDLLTTQVGYILIFS